MTDDSAEIFIQSFLQEAFVRSSGMGRAVPAHAMDILAQNQLKATKISALQQFPLKGNFFQDSINLQSVKH